MYIKLNKVQNRQLTSAINKKTPLEISLSRAQVKTASETPVDGAINIPLSDVQIVKLKKAQQVGSKCVLKILKKQIQTGGFVPLIPLLLASLPGLLGSAPQILDGVKSGYENLGKLVGINPAQTGNGILEDFASDIFRPVPLKKKIDKTGTSLKIHGGQNDINGTSLMIHGETTNPRQKKGIQVLPITPNDVRQ